MEEVTTLKKLEQNMDEWIKDILFKIQGLEKMCETIEEHDYMLKNSMFSYCEIEKDIKNVKKQLAALFLVCRTHTLILEKIVEKKKKKLF